MKNLLGFAALLLTLSACNRYEEEKQALRNLSEDWNETYALVNAFVDQTETLQINWQEKYDRMQLTRAEMAAFDEGTLAVLTEIKTTCSEHGIVYDDIAEAVEAFAIEWEEQTGQLEDLETLIDDDVRVPDLADQVAAYRAILDAVPGRLQAWRLHLENTHEECQQNCQQFERLASEMGQ